MALTLSERIFLPKYQVAAIGITTFELKVRLLADTDQDSSPHRDAITGDLTALINTLCDHLQASTEQRVFLVAFAKLRNDILHLKLSKASGKITALAKSVGELPAISGGKVTMLNLEAGTAHEVAKTSTATGRIFGWLMESTMSGAFDAVAAASHKAIDILDELRDRAYDDPTP
jgi:hypothetical protein